MIEIICGEKGKGKTKDLLEKVNSAIQSASGNVVCFWLLSKYTTLPDAL